MRTVAIALLACALHSWIVNSAIAGNVAPSKTEHPANVALIHDETGWKYVHFPSSMRLYVFDRDSAGQSACNLGCDGAWPPLPAGDNEKPLGDWTIIVRYDGNRQWAYLGRPVYGRFHDSVEAPSGNGIDGAWHFLEP
jgi:predicted lipoprotein with Yx(FWY)xxD motif